MQYFENNYVINCISDIKYLKKNILYGVFFQFLLVFS